MVFFLLPALPAILPALLPAVGLLSLTAVGPALNSMNRNGPVFGVNNLPSISNRRYQEGLPASRYDPRKASTQVPKIIEAITPKTILVSLEDPCKKDNGGCKQFCHAIDGEAKCSCAPGFILGPDGKRCIRMKRPKNITKEREDKQRGNGAEECQQPCVPERNETVCECPDGYKPNDDKRCCIDMNITKDGEDKHNSEEECQTPCVSERNETVCECPEGYKPDDDKKCCIDMNIKKDREDQTNSEEECQQPCLPERNETVCECPEGYKPNDDKKCCIDVNECTDDNFGCSHSCVNTPGSAHCSCPPGYTIDIDNKICIDVNECEEEILNNCQHECINTDGGYTCSCRPGYISIDDFKCVDIDECIDNNFGCTHTCVNTPGGAHCYCPEGFMLYGDKTCIAECPPDTKWSETTKLCEQIKRRRGMIID